MAGFLILGMHRSGTSCLAGCLEAGGMRLGAVNTYAPFNRKGNREHEPIRDVHDEILSLHGRSWDNPPEQQIPITCDHLRRLRQHVDAIDTSNHWGVKDPRSMFFANSWQQNFDCNFIGTFRHPVDVAKSLESRAARTGKTMNRENSLQLWKIYNTQLLELHRANRFQLIRYGIDVKLYSDQIRDISRRLNLNPNEATEFYTQDLTHHSSVETPVPKCCQDIWDNLTSAWEDFERQCNPRKT
ncbi:MAG: hypothetical protein ACE37M_13045 [Henriciella sp.]